MRATLIVLIVLLGLRIAPAQSTNCKLAQSAREQAICSDPQLAALDTALADAYKSAAVQLSPTSFALVESDQRDWLHWLELACSAHVEGSPDFTECLRYQYRLRKSELYINRIGNTLVYDRTRFVRVKHPFDSGFYSGIFTWPQIDEPTEAQSAWNSSVESRLLQATAILSRRTADKSPETLTSAGDITASAWLISLNNRLIDTEFETSASITNAFFNYWLDRNRELRPEDLFRPTDGWQQQLSAIAADRLRSQDAATFCHLVPPPPAQDAQLARNLQTTVINPDNWTVTRSGLAIILPQFHGNCMPLGNPTIHLTWDELKPLLEPSLNSTTLPAPLPRDPRHVKI